MATAAKPTRKLSLIARTKRVIKRAIAGRPGLEPSKRAAIYPPSPFATWTYEDAEAAIDAALEAQTIDTSSKAQTNIAPAPGDVRFAPNRRLQDPVAVNRAFYTGDHWQQGSGYIGPHPALNEIGFTDAMTEISSIFTSQNAVREVTDRHVSGVVGKPVRWALVPRRDTGEQKPTKEEQTAIDEASAIVRRWLTARKVPTLLGNTVATLLLAERGAIRLSVPAGLTTTDAAGRSLVSAATVEEGLGKIWPEHPMPEHSTVACDDDTKLEAGVIAYEADSDDPEDDTPADYAWVCFLNEVGDTVIKLLDADDVTSSDAGNSAAAEGVEAAENAEADAYQAAFDLGGRLAMFEMRRPALITPQVQQAQRGLNFALTMVPRNVTTGGFLERLLLDAQLPGKPELDTNGNKTGRWLLDKLQIGAGKTTFVQGTTWTDENGVVHHAQPSAVYREPVKPDASLAAKDAHYRSILAEVGQLHVLIAGDATASAVARVQARAEYLATLLKTKPEVEGAVTWLIETALAMAEAIAGTPGKYTKLLRVQATCKLDTGPITPEERKAIEASIGVTISAETAMLMLDVEDVDAEKSRMADDPNSRAKFAQSVGDALTKLTAAGATLEGAAKFLKLSKDEVDALMTPETFAALPGGVRLQQPKPGPAGEVIEPQPAEGEPPGVGGGPAALAAAKPASASGSAPGGAQGGSP